MQPLVFDVAGETVTITPQNVVVAGWTGRDAEAVEHHIVELEAIGVARPSAVPLCYRVGCDRLTQDGTIDVVGDATSGEAEPVLVVAGARVLLTVGSDHTDRALEAHSVALSKQIAPKPVGRTGVWLDEAADLDRWTLTSEVSDDGNTFRPYQNGTLAMNRPLGEVLALAKAAVKGAHEGLVVFCGTVPTLCGKIDPARHFRATLADPASGSALTVASTSRNLTSVS